MGCAVPGPIVMISSMAGALDGLAVGIMVVGVKVSLRAGTWELGGAEDGLTLSLGLEVETVGSSVGARVGFADGEREGLRVVGLVDGTIVG